MTNLPPTRAGGDTCGRCGKPDPLSVHGLTGCNDDVPMVRRDPRDADLLGRYALDPRVYGTRPYFKLGGGNAVWIVNNPSGVGIRWAAGTDGTLGTVEHIRSLHERCEDAAASILGPAQTPYAEADDLCRETVQPAGEDPQPCGLELPCPDHSPDHTQAVKDLRAAAKLLNQLAAQATPGPWVRQSVTNPATGKTDHLAVAGITTRTAEAGALVATFPAGNARARADVDIATALNPDVVRALGTLFAGFASMRATAIRAAREVGTNEVPTWPVELKAHAIAVTLLNAARAAADAQGATG